MKSCNSKMVSVEVTCVILAVMLGLYSGCAGSKSTESATKTVATMYRFDYQDQEYRIISIFSSDEEEAENRLLGKNLVAVDYNKDRLLDRIVIGDISLIDAQAIYELGIKAAAAENKIVEKKDETPGFLYEKTGTSYEIKSFHPSEATAFNEFHITDSTTLLRKELAVLVDRGADGTLDEVLKGTISLEQAQEKYVEAITTGLKKRKLVRDGQKFVVKP